MYSFREIVLNTSLPIHDVARSMKIWEIWEITG